ncbi:LysR substrate-binding domain-containing protein [Bordetella genomosp. 12]|nr:LysR substrate-binding domain-containing protein [Bordetella genomosp. 12]
MNTQGKPDPSAMSNLEHRISLRHLRLIDVIEREGSLVRAAERLNMTQSAVTKALQEVEALIGVALFRRTSRGAVATACGQMLVGHARGILTQLRRVSRDLDEWREGHGSVAIGTLPSAAGGLLPQAVARVIGANPALRVSISEGQHEWLTTLLRRGELDLVVGRLPPGGVPVDIEQKVLGPDRAQLVVRASHPLLQMASPSLADMKRWPWILPPVNASLRRQIDSAFEAAELEPPVPHVESMSFLSNRTLLLAADFITIWPHHLADVEAGSGLVVALPIELPDTERPIGVWWRAESGLSPSAGLIVQALAAC